MNAEDDEQEWVARFKKTEKNKKVSGEGKVRRKKRKRRKMIIMS